MSALRQPHPSISSEQIAEALGYIAYMASKIEADASETFAAHVGNPDPRDRHLSWRYHRVAQDIRSLAELLQKCVKEPRI